MNQIEEILSPNDLLALVKIAGELAMRIDPEDLIQIILAKSGELTDSPDGAVILYNKERDSLYFAGAIGEDAAMLLDQFGEFSTDQVPVNGSNAGKVFSSGQSVMIESVSTDPWHYKGIDEETGRATLSMLCVPLIAAGEKLGAIQLLNKRTGNYNLRDQLLLEQFGSYAAVAIRNAGLFEELIAHMGLYASRENSGGVAELLNQLKSPPRAEKLTVLLADMRGFRMLCQVINSPKILEFTSQFITMLSSLVLSHGGVVNKFLGDGIFALFRNGDHARRAVACAFKMLDEFSVLRKTWDENSPENLNFIDIGIGITTDEIIIGTIGSAKVRDFTAIGTAVNLAAAFEKEARGGRRILTDHFTYLAVRDMVGEIEGPFDYELSQPDQRKGNIYKQYHLKKMAPVLKTTVFISHNTSDQEFAEQDLIKLLDTNGIGHWYSKNDIKGGESWVQSINEGLDLCSWVLVIISASSAKSLWVREEVNMAAAQSRLLNRIIPVCLDETKPEEVHPFLRHKQAIDARDRIRYSAGLIAIIKSAGLKI